MSRSLWEALGKSLGTTLTLGLVVDGHLHCHGFSPVRYGWALIRLGTWRKKWFVQWTRIIIVWFPFPFNDDDLGHWMD